jgi:integrase
MASVTTDKRTGIHRIQFTTKDGKRQTIQVGKILKTEARDIGKHIDHLIRCSKTTEEPKEQTAKWIAEVRKHWPRIANKLNKLRLIGNGARVDEVFVEFCERFILNRKDVKSGTTRIWNQTVAQLRAFFGNRSLKELTKADGSAFLRYLRMDKETGGAGLGQASAGKYMGFTKQFLNEAVDSEIIPANPFSRVKTPRKTNKSRQRFIDQQTIAAVSEMAPDAEMRLIIALSRYGGLRTPSESFALRWQDIDWKRQRIHVTSPKTEHHEGHESRDIPLFPELLKPLLEVQERTKGKNGSGRESNPPGDFSAATTGLKPATVTRSAYTSGSLRRHCSRVLLWGRHPACRI